MGSKASDLPFPQTEYPSPDFDLVTHCARKMIVIVDISWLPACPDGVCGAYMDLSSNTEHRRVNSDNGKCPDQSDVLICLVTM